MKIKTKMIIEINGHKIEVSEAELIELRDRLNKLTNYNQPIINFPPVENPIQPYREPEPYNPWHTPVNPNVPWYNPTPIVYC